MIDQVRTLSYASGQFSIRLMARLKARQIPVRKHLTPTSGEGGGRKGTLIPKSDRDSLRNQADLRKKEKVGISRSLTMEFSGEFSLAV